LYNGTDILDFNISGIGRHVAQWSVENMTPDHYMISNRTFSATLVVDVKQFIKTVVIL